MGHDSITCFGLGAMGSALARSFQKAGLKVHIWNRTRDRAEVKALVDGGATLETDPAAAIKATQLIVICLLDYPSVYQVFDPIDRSLFKDKILVNLTTANAAEGPEMSKWAAERGVKNYFDGAIMHVPPHVGTKHACTFISGGTEAAFREIEPSLNSTGEHEYLGEEVNSSAVHDAALLLGMYGMFGGCLTGIALLSKVKKGQTKDIVTRRMIPALTGLMEWLEEAAEGFDKGSWETDICSNEVNAHALHNSMKSCEIENVDLSCVKGISRMFDRSVEDGKGKQGMACLINYYLGK